MSYNDEVFCATRTKTHFDTESRFLEGVTTCVGFDDVLDITLQKNMPHFDHFIVVTSHADKKTQKVARKHGAICVETDLFKKNGRNFNKGAAINAGFDYFQRLGWRLHLDCDIVLPDNFRRLLFNHTQIDWDCIYGCDRMDVVGMEKINAFLGARQLQHESGCLLHPKHGELAHRYIDNLREYVPIGFFQLWHASCHKPYPYSLGTAQHDDVMFGSLWPRTRRHLLPSVITYHLCATPPAIGENWDGNRRQGRIEK